MNIWDGYEIVTLILWLCFYGLFLRGGGYGAGRSRLTLKKTLLGDRIVYMYLLGKSFKINI